jgi:hypothetical protein
MAELVDALVSGTSGESRGGSSPLLGTSSMFHGCSLFAISLQNRHFLAKSMTSAKAVCQLLPTAT